MMDLFFNQDRTQLPWPEIEKRALDYWAKLTPEDFENLNESLASLRDRVQHIYGYTRDEAEEDFASFVKRMNAKPAA